MSNTNSNTTRASVLQVGGHDTGTGQQNQHLATMEDNIMGDKNKRKSMFCYCRFSDNEDDWRPSEWLRIMDKNGQYCSDKFGSILNGIRMFNHLKLEVGNNRIRMEATQSYIFHKNWPTTLVFKLFATDANNWTRNMDGWTKKRISKNRKTKKLEKLIQQDLLMADERRMILHAILSCNSFPSEKIISLDCDNETNQNILLEVLLEYPKINSYEFSSCYSRSGNWKRPSAEQKLSLCTKLCNASTNLNHVAFDGLHDYYPCDIQTIMTGIAKTSVDVLNFNSSKDLDTYSKNVPGYPKEGFPINLDTILSAIIDPLDPFRVESLEVGGNIVESTYTLKKFLAILPSLSLKHLSFRGCMLSEDVLVALAESLKSNTTLTCLDLSHNRLTFEIVKKLSVSLEANGRLKSMKLEHCGINIRQANCLAKSFPKIKFLEELYLDGNPFTWKPLTKEKQSKGALLLLLAMERNHSLSTLSMGEHDKVVLIHEWICCTAPEYNLALNGQNRRLLKSYLSRNRTEMEQFFVSRARQATVEISRILLTKS
mmetsp:Transcript_54177/g.131471  ORF Transcript_54177/g.131471 Transcript_54177/m.131471 type:complete len:541 (-) Transcript_54177:275-1897(-)